MRKASLTELKPGMIIASDVMTGSGQRIFDKGTILTPQMIMRLSFYNIDFIHIEEDISQESVQPVLQSPQESPVSMGFPAEKPNMTPELSHKIKTSLQFQTFQIDHSFAIASIQNNFEAFVNQGTPLQTEVLLDNVRKLFYTCKTSKELFDMLHNMRSSGESIYFHALNVALLCRQMGKWLKLPESQLDLLTLCGLFHDIGKLRIPAEILNKPGKYTDEEFAFVKNHPVYGYELLKNLPIDAHIKNAALSHHERCDGSGYPSGLHMAETDDYAMVVSIADVYDAMTAARSYRAPLCPFQVINGFEQEGLKKYKPKYILTFLSHIANIYQNSRILLSDGRSANIVMLNDKALSKPIIQLDDGSCIDLSTEHGLHIQAVM